MEHDPEKNAKSSVPTSELAAASYAASTEEVQAIQQTRFQYLKWYFTSKEGWIGEYVSTLYSHHLPH